MMDRVQSWFLVTFFEGGMWLSFVDSIAGEVRKVMLD